MERKTTVITPEQLRRQQAFCQEIRAYWAQQGRTPTAFVDTYGCQQNEADSERIRGMLEQCGYELQADAEGADYCVLPIGTKAVEHIERRKAAILTTAFAEAGDLSVSDCFEISRLVCQKFLAGEFDEIRLGFTQFVSMLTQTATVLPVLPFDAQRPEPGHERESLMMYEPDGKTVFDAIIPEYLAGVVYGALCESVASEQGARRMAMDAATKNAGEMIDHLNLYYNRARQAAITQEITEIVAGADAES